MNIAYNNHIFFNKKTRQNGNNGQNLFIFRVLNIIIEVNLTQESLDISLLLFEIIFKYLRLDLKAIKNILSVFDKQKDKKQKMKSKNSKIDQQGINLDYGMRQSSVSENNNSRPDKVTSKKSYSSNDEFPYQQPRYRKSQRQFEDQRSYKSLYDSIEHTKRNNHLSYQYQNNPQSIKYPNQNRNYFYQKDDKKESIDRMRRQYYKQRQQENRENYYNYNHRENQQVYPAYNMSRSTNRNNCQQFPTSKSDRYYYEQQRQSNANNYYSYYNDQQPYNNNALKHNRQYQQSEKRHRNNNERLSQYSQRYKQSSLPNNISRPSNQWQHSSFCIPGQKILGSQIQQRYSFHQLQQQDIERHNIVDRQNLSPMLDDLSESIIISHPQIIEVLENHFPDLRETLQGMSDQNKLKLLLQMLDQEKKILSNPQIGSQEKKKLSQKLDVLNDKLFQIVERQSELAEHPDEIRNNKRAESKEQKIKQQTDQQLNLQPLKRTLQTTQILVKGCKLVKTICKSFKKNREFGGVERLTLVGLATAIYWENLKKKSSNLPTQVNQSSSSTQSQNETKMKSGNLFKKKQQSSTNYTKQLTPFGSAVVNFGNQFSKGTKKAYQALFPNAAKRMYAKKQ